MNNMKFLRNLPAIAIGASAMSFPLPIDANAGWKVDAAISWIAPNTFESGYVLHDHCALGYRIYVAPVGVENTEWQLIYDKPALDIPFCPIPNPSLAQIVASVPFYSRPGVYTTYTSQKSDPIFLEAQRKYYIRLLQKEGTGGDNFSVSWKGPNIPQQVIPAECLSPYQGSSTSTTGIIREWWMDIPGDDVASLVESENYPHQPDGSELLTSFQGPTNWADKYGTRVHGYLHPPVSGMYEFFVGTDNQGELWLNSEAPYCVEFEDISLPSEASGLQAYAVSYLLNQQELVSKPSEIAVKYLDVAIVPTPLPGDPPPNDSYQGKITLIIRGSELTVDLNPDPVEPGQ